MQSTVGENDETVTTRLLENRRSIILIPFSAESHTPLQTIKY